jgi:hypothetical protein
MKTLRNGTATGLGLTDGGPNFSLLLAGFLVSSLVIASTIFAQERTGGLSGVVKDQSGGVLPGVVVTATNEATNRSISAKSDQMGSYRILELEPGRYRVKFELTGFSNAVVQDVIVLLGRILEVNTSLQLGAVEQVVEVSGGASLIDMVGTMVAHDVTAEEFERMPKARSFQDMALTSPSVNSGQIEGGIQVHGASGAENNYMIDGISTTSLIDGNSRQDAIYEFLQEVEVKTSGLEAEYGGALGGVISAVTKSGGNAFHGDIHWYNSGSPFNALPNLRLEIDPVDNTSTQFFQDNKIKDHINEIGGSLGGYIVKHKLYFFSAFSPVIEHREANILFDNGATPGTFNSSTTSLNMFNKLSWDVTPRIRTNFSWLYTTTKQAGLIPAFNGYAPNSNVNSISASESFRNQGWYLPKNSYTGTTDITLSNTSLLSFRGGYFWDNFKDFGVTDVHTIQYNRSAIGLPFAIPPELIQPSGWFNVPPTYVHHFDNTTRGYFQADYSKTFHLLGTHNLKGGAGFQKNVNKVDVGYQGGGYYVEIYWNDAYTNPANEVGRGTYGYYRLQQVPTQGSAGSTIDNMYIQDQWRILPRLSLSLGLRTEKENIPSFRRDIQEYAMQFGWGDKLSPRLGASYDLFGNGKLKIFGSWGRFYDWTKYTLVRGSFGGDIWRIWYHALDTTDLASITLATLPGKNLWSDDPNSYWDLRLPSFGPDSVDPNIKPMHQDTMVAGVEFQLNPSSVVSAHYLHSNLSRTIEDIGQVQPDGNVIYPLGNPGEGRFVMETNHISLTPDFPMPKPKRQYDALEVSFNRRFSKNWFLGANYTYSRLYGNYSGLADTDEIEAKDGWVTDQVPDARAFAMTARPGTNTTTYYDSEAYLLDSKGQYLNGRLATDRPHVFKAYGSYTFRWGTSLSLNFYAGSGTPLTTTAEDLYWDPLMVNGRGDAGRTPALTTTNFMVSHEIKIKETMRLRFEFNVLNLFNQQTVRHRDMAVNRFRDESSEIDLSNVNLLQGFNWQQLFSQTTYAQDPTKSTDPTSFDPHKNFSVNPYYGLPDIWNPGLSARIGVKFIF